jgi:hypothetical protein
MLAAYLDASGSAGDSAHMVLAGFVADVDKWLQFEKWWTDLLKEPKYQLEYAHARKMAQWRAEKLEMFCWEANYLLRRTVLFGAAAMLRMKDYKTIFPDNRISNKDSPYGLCFRSIMATICNHVSESWPEETVAFFLEEGDAGQDGAKLIFNVTRAGHEITEVMTEMQKLWPVETLTIAPKTSFGALQAADQYAHGLWKHREKNHSVAITGGSIAALLQGLNISHFEIDRGSVLSMRRNLIEGKRDGKKKTWDQVVKDTKRLADSVRRRPEEDS